MKQIPLGKDKFCVLDDEDYSFLSKWKWFVNDKGYAVRKTSTRDENNKIISKSIRMHRVVINAMVGLDVDHINGDRLDNRKCNLRICTRSQNHQNKIKSINKSSLYKGVDFRKDRNKWRATIKDNKKYIFIGHYENEEDAALAYNAKAKELFGEFAKLNVIENKLAA